MREGEIRGLGFPVYGQAMMYRIVAGATSQWIKGQDGCRGATWGPNLDISSNFGQPYSLWSNPAVKAAGCRCCEPASSQCPNCDCETFTFMECVSLCSNAGGRLCTEAEMLSEVTKLTGCQFDQIHVWTSQAQTLQP